MAIHSCRVVEATKKHQKSQYLNVLNHETEKERKYVVFASNNIIQDNNMTSYTEAIKRELKQLNDYGQISEIKKTELNSTILSHLEMSNDLVDAVKTDWNAKGIFKRIEKEEDKQIVVDSYCTRPYVQDVILRYCQNRSIFKTKFAIIDGMLLE